MKLVFPNGEHAQVLLHHGVNNIGSESDGAVVLTKPGILPVHCVIHVTATGANLQVPPGAGPASVNGRQVTDMMALRPGDTLNFGSVVAKFAVVEIARASAVASGLGEEDTGATRVRMAVPKYLLRGVSGAVFSKVYPITGPMIIGRAVDCDIAVTAEEISRKHALVKPTPEGIAVEDLGSSNGTYINNKRVQRGILNPGDELRLDAVRFIAVAPGMEVVPPTTKSEGAGKPKLTAQNMQMWASILLTLAAVVVIVMLIRR